MLVDFSELPDDARVWIYASNRAFTDKEIKVIYTDIREFLSGWQTHGKDIVSGCELRYNRFIIIGVNQNIVAPSGCSIDVKVRKIQEIERDYGVDLIDRINVLFWRDNCIVYETPREFKKSIKEKIATPDTIVFNNIITNVFEYKNLWETPARNSWHNRFFVKTYSTHK